MWPSLFAFNPFHQTTPSIGQRSPAASSSPFSPWKVTTLTSLAIPLCPCLASKSPACSLFRSQSPPFYWQLSSAYTSLVCGYGLMFFYGGNGLTNCTFFFARWVLPVVRRVLTRHFFFDLLGRREDGTAFRTATVDLSTSPTLPLSSLVKRTRPDGLNPNQCSSRLRSPIKAARCLNKTLDTEQARVSLTIIPSLNDFI